MRRPLRLACVLAHPDDESMGTGGALAKYGAEGVRTYLLTATRGERGWFGDERAYPGPEALGRLREAELRDAARTLGVEEVAFLGYRDGELAQADPAEAVGRVVAHLRRVRPDVVVTFDPWGVYGHPDHIAICQIATAAVVAAADAAFEAGEAPPHRVAKLYYRVWTREEVATFEAAFGELAMEVDGQRRHWRPWEEWAITTRLDTSAHWERVWEAVACHRSQLPNYGKLRALSEGQQRALWGSEAYYRASSLVSGGPVVERDLFAGLR